MKLGIQLYNFRNALGTDFKGTLREIAGLGYDGVEFACNYGGMAPEELAAFLQELHLECAGTMFTDAELVAPDNQAFEYALALASPAVTFSLMVDFVKEYDCVLDKIRAAGKAAAIHGLIFSYHNHWGEMRRMKDQTVLESLMAETDPAQVFPELDVCWIQAGGENPVRLIKRYAKRMSQIHIKDSRNPSVLEETTELGRGVVDLTGCLAALQKTDCRWLIVEQDFSSDPFRSAAENLAWMKKQSILS